MANPVLQFQIISNDPDKCARFYSELFEWKINTNNAIGYRTIDTGSTKGIQGGIWPAPPQAGTFLQFFVSVDDVKSAVARAEQLGGRLLIPPTVLPDGDEMAVMHDPQGMSFALLKSREAQ